FARVERLKLKRHEQIELTLLDPDFHVAASAVDLFIEPLRRGLLGAQRGNEVSQRYMPMMWELFNEPFDIRPDGMVHAPDRSGLGFTLRADALARFIYVDGPEYKF